MSKTKMVEVIIDSVRVSLTNQQRIVVLRDINAERYLPIWIGPYEAESITIALQEIEVSRPQTHDLIKNIFNQLNARLLRVEVLSLKDDVFYGILIVEIDGEIFEIDSRPSDALALAARTHAKILVSDEVMNSAGIVPEIDIQESEANQDAAPLANTNQPEEDISEERLSVFEDFLGSLDIGGIDENDTDEDDSEESPPDDEPEK
ncbi:MAG TPA: bifunctional nuclease family protein [Anaerolineaceae bacterium]|nr:bifunctional nuclease family protein [Anaerolineaceae bacterium]